ncbi:glycosyltransferase family 2 protein [Shinella daejeonensis]|uniref:glycosyltransferase family 2 protein n=1 Tax=Shinella daejeonensis TaxID=659017 RepID=UPI0020C759A7|nr:glycosyltransferase family 2 protein [Shinella daejeonensis]
MATAIGIAMPAGEPPPPAFEVPLPFMAEARLFRRLGFSKPLISSLLLRANRNGTSLEAELLAGGHMKEAVYYEALAELLDLPFLPVLDAGLVQDLPGADSQLVEPRLVRLHHPSRPPVTAIVPEAVNLMTLAGRLERCPPLRTALAITTPSALRKAIWEVGSHRRLRETIDGLFKRTPEASARVTLWGRQGFYAGVWLAASLCLAILRPDLALLFTHLLLSLFFFATFSIRLEALRSYRGGRKSPLPPRPDKPRPVYSVFVALHREAAVMPQLIRTLNRLDWPRSRLDIKLICEADDAETLVALAAIPLGPQYEIVLVPPGEPRTKPKALSYALGAARGQFLAIYDAEDRVEPQQLEEAWRTFENGPADIACLQAPLVITNLRNGWLCALFGLEYAGLFRALLPRLGAARLPMPLGGTSNHFRTETLRAVGGWDPHNVTEDADLGLRLYRHGYRCGTITRPTYEDAPPDAPAWIGQRTRWFKGWLQTWLVLTRSPARLVREMGLWQALVAQVLIGGLILSAFFHPLVVVYLALVVWLMQRSMENANLLTSLLFAVDLTNILGSYAIFILLGRTAMSPAERAAVGHRWIYTPAYWLLMSYASWRALQELPVKPFFWNKTHHQPSGKDEDLPIPPSGTLPEKAGGPERPGNEPAAAWI